VETRVASTLLCLSQTLHIIRTGSPLALLCSAIGPLSSEVEEIETILLGVWFSHLPLFQASGTTHPPNPTPCIGCGPQTRSLPDSTRPSPSPITFHHQHVRFFIHLRWKSSLKPGLAVGIMQSRNYGYQQANRSPAARRGPGKHPTPIFMHLFHKPLETSLWIPRRLPGVSWHLRPGLVPWRKPARTRGKSAFEILS
jgi:hypothetical protein